ncbi:hypothetical protein N7457_002762 [Penicillium paradoxum]|uniref:uncharacterized protein n=1 Tax=Penicillium paradoxum TaxID=176176 RepID=UPI002549342D|nr:uncharacterized protein N7457_002762 [Penicillium paradoxum]KAJ5787772.1 hypothetical protein N7457_002762 [Penicillium paradoxum]
MPQLLTPLTRLYTSRSPNIFTSVTPFSLSISLSFGGSGISFPASSSQIPTRDDQTHDIDPEEQNDGTNVPQGFVILAFLAIFLAQVGINFLHAVRTGRRRRRLLEMQFPQPLPQRDQETDRGLNREPEANTNPIEENARNDAEEPPVTEDIPGVG